MLHSPMLWFEPPYETLLHNQITVYDRTRLRDVIRYHTIPFYRS